MQLTELEYKSRLEGYAISDCAVRKRGEYYFVLRNIQESDNAGPTAEGTVTKRITRFSLRRPDLKRIEHTSFEGYRELMVGASQHNEDNAFGISVDGKVFVTGDSVSDDENDIPRGKDGPSRGAIARIRMIAGVLYAVGSAHTVCYRSGQNSWESLCRNLPVPTRADYDDVTRSLNMAFVDIDGFSADDLYAIAGQGRLWHFNGNDWNAVPFPSNMYLQSICCAGDGYVYIGAQSGGIFRGRGSEWTLIVQAMLTLPFQDIVWHAARLWLTNDHGIWNLADGTPVEATLPSSDIKVCAGHLSVADGVLLMAGTHGAAVHDGTAWELIFHRPQFA